MYTICSCVSIPDSQYRIVSLAQYRQSVGLFVLITTFVPTRNRWTPIAHDFRFQNRNESIKTFIHERSFGRPNTLNLTSLASDQFWPNCFRISNFQQLLLQSQVGLYVILLFVYARVRAFAHLLAYLSFASQVVFEKHNPSPLFD